MSYQYNGVSLNDIFQTGTGATMTGYKINNTSQEFLTKFANLPDQELGYKNNNTDIGTNACPKYTKYIASTNHICHSKATGVYLILVGGGGGGGSGGANSSFAGDGGGGGGGGGMLALKVSKSENLTITTPITISITIGTGGSGASRRTSDGEGYTGNKGGNTTARILCSGNDISANAFGGVGGKGGPNNNDGIINDTGGLGGTKSIELLGGTPISSNDNSENGQKGDGGEDGTGPDNDISRGGYGGDNGYSIKNFFQIESPFVYGNGGFGGAGDTTTDTYTQTDRHNTNSITWDATSTGSNGQSGNSGVAYIFEYFN
jgi:hypothetical protein